MIQIQGKSLIWSCGPNERFSVGSSIKITIIRKGIKKPLSNKYN